MTKKKKAGKYSTTGVFSGLQPRLPINQLDNGKNYINFFCEQALAFGEIALGIAYCKSVSIYFR
ncbi:hypothetical protein, partial [Sporomusa sp.]|uniref:hypothetical protein n=1 Tax=Sporomusa sp. TaxID=2078658 RepID=UPI002C1FD1A3